MTPAVRLLLVSILGWLAAPSASAKDDPEARWLYGYSLAQTGQQLAEQALWPLALANYSAALTQLQSLLASHPDFERRLMDYRIADLKQRIEAANESMGPGEHDLAMHYEDAIETAWQGATRRFALDFEGSYRFLVRAQWQMEEMLGHSPAPVAAALAKQRAYVEEITAATREDLIKTPGGALKLNRIEKDFAAAVTIAMSDLPSFREETIRENESGMSAALFPEELVLQARSEWY